MSFEEPNDPRSSEIGNNQIQLTELATYEERKVRYDASDDVCFRSGLVALFLKTSECGDS